MIDFDVETTGLQPWSGKHKAFMYQFGDSDGNAVILDPETDREEIQKWFDRSADEGLRAWNSKFDISFAYQDGFKLPPEDQWHDGMLIAHAMDERYSSALKATATRVLGDGSDDLQKEVKKWLTDERARRKKQAKEDGVDLVEPTYADVTRGLMEKYAIEDIHLTRRVCEHFEPLLVRNKDLFEVVEFEREVMAALWNVERRGFPVDEEGYRRLELEVIENLEEFESKLDALASVGIEPDDLEDFEFNPKSSKQILDALKRRGADLKFVTNDSMDAENLNTVDDELARAVLDFRAEFKALSTYVRPMIGRSYETSLRAWKEPFIGPDGRIHANYRQVGTRTGRMSCSDPNIQNQPRDDLRLRYNFRAEPGHKLVTCDLNSIEMAVFAAYAGPGALLNAIREGADLHQMTADFIGIRDRVRSGGHIEKARQRGKTFNFSVIYGGGIRTIRKQQRVDSKEARKMLDRYYDAYPEVRNLQNIITYRLHDQGYIKSAWGRRFRCDNPDKEAYKFINYLVQGSSADLLKASLIRLHKEGVPVVACVHDEIIAHVPEAEAEEAKQAIITALTDHPRITEKVPLAAEGDIVDRWSEAKDPNFKPRWAS